MKQTITLKHLNGETSDFDIVIPDNNPIEQIELSVVWEEGDVMFELEDRKLDS